MDCRVEVRSEYSEQAANPSKNIDCGRQHSKPKLRLKFFEFACKNKTLFLMNLKVEAFEIRNTYVFAFAFKNTLRLQKCQRAGNNQEEGNHSITEFNTDRNILVNFLKRVIYLTLVAKF